MITGRRQHLQRVLLVSKDCNRSPVVYPSRGTISRCRRSSSPTSGQGSPSPTEPSPTAPSVTDLTSLVDNLRAAGLKVEVNGEDNEFFFSVRGTILLVDDGAVKVFEYGNAGSADADAARISPDGFTVEVPSDGETAVTDIFWVSSPHFYKKRKLIVLYVGDDADLIGAVEAKNNFNF